eukprot:TRINITY_DN37717_c0_g1_i1.p2 TRINITY_DN37717_c0_g1~~TRINITY_DN37717_c0_g1_i1.p2  ORF type:complete len:114 (-),score=20.36 TRINITY_DN37717_c0_g1_i1:77-418(-)
MRLLSSLMWKSAFFVGAVVFVMGAPDRRKRPLMHLFDTYGTDDKLKGEVVDAIIDKLTPGSRWNWYSADKDQDKHLHRREVPEFRAKLAQRLPDWKEKLNKLIESPEGLQLEL